MVRQTDLLVIGAGPAGMSAAIAARQYGLDVLVVDEQGTPGGQIWRNVEDNSSTRIGSLLGTSYLDGLNVVRSFRASGARYEPYTQLWHIESGPRALLKHNGRLFIVKPKCLLLATGAQERPMPFPGWTIPGVMTVGAAQILLKSSGQVPKEPVWIAGNGPLPLLYATQLLKAGGRLAGFLSTTPHERLRQALPKLAAAASAAPGDLLKGLKWLTFLKRSAPYIEITDVEAIGPDRLQQIRYRTNRGEVVTADAKVLLVHEGVIPTIHPTLGLGCNHRWNADQDSFSPALDIWGQTSEPDVFVAGDAAGIGGANAACLRGEIAALGIAIKARVLQNAKAVEAAKSLRTRLTKALASRPFLDTLYKPRKSVFLPDGQTIACRCEEVTAFEIREQVAKREPGPDQVKAFTRAGMGPCQGRQCNYTTANILANEEGRLVPDIGLYRVRPPLKPITLGELAAFDNLDAVE